MATELELAAFEEQLEEVRGLPEAARWTLEREGDFPLGLIAVMYPRSKSDELFRARLRWTDLYGPFSMKFLNAAGADTDPAAWPRCEGFRPAAVCACVPWTVEGHGLHPDWKDSALNRFPNVTAPLQFALLTVQSALDNTYEGRGPQ